MLVVCLKVQLIDIFVGFGEVGEYYGRNLLVFFMIFLGSFVVGKGFWVIFFCVVLFSCVGVEFWSFVFLFIFIQFRRFIFEQCFRVWIQIFIVIFSCYVFCFFLFQRVLFFYVGGFFENLMVFFLENKYVRILVYI